MMKYTKKKGLPVQIVGLLLAMVLTGVVGRFAIIKLYPLVYEDIIKECAIEYSLPGELIAAVIREESRFDSEAVSHRQAVGLMQLTPETAQWIALKINCPPPSTKELADPAINIQLGSAYLAYLMDLFGNDEELALAAYNGGHANVSKWLEQGTWDGELASVKDIPFGETRGFVCKVASSRQIYSRFYGNVFKK